MAKRKQNQNRPKTTGKQSKIPNGFIKVGRINMTIAREAHIKTADIVVDENHLVHIGNEHKSQLQPLGLNATLKSYWSNSRRLGKQNAMPS